MKGNENVLFLALGFLVDFVLIAGVQTMTKEKYPKFSKWTKVLVGIPVTATLLVCYRYGAADAATFGDRILAFIPYLAVALWAMLVLELVIQGKENKKRIDALQVILDANSTGTTKSTVNKIDLTKGADPEHVGTPFSLLPHHIRTQIKLAGNPHANEIAMAVRGKWGKSAFDNVETDNMQCDGYFLEYTRWEPGGRYLSDTMIFRETDEAQVSPELESKLRNACRFFVPQANIHRNVSLVLFVYKNLTVSEKVSLRHQLEMISKSENDPQNVRFEFWDKTDLDKYSLP